MNTRLREYRDRLLRMEALRVREQVAGHVLTAQTGWVPDSDDEDQLCHQCDGDGWGIVGVDWDPDDYINGPYVGEIERCTCCGGSGKAEDCTYW